MLLHRLFAFVRTTEAPLNAVLAGYFAKVVTLLINRQPKQILPFLFQEGPGEDIIDHLVRHIYQRSISEVVNKLMNVSDH